MPDGFTIGEVLNLLKDDFEEITISKIRFLESEGLVYPDRTESGYRKFSEDDVDRLRFILTAQRDHYLPLKVIREQLDRVDAGDPPSAQGNGGASPPAPSPRSGGDVVQALDAVEAAQAPLLAPLAPTGDDVSLGLRELCEATGLDPAQVRALREYGMVSDPVDDEAGFDTHDAAAGRAAAQLFALGLEARHLRMYRQFVDREVALFEQLATPLLRQRSPEARRQVTAQLETLGGAGGRLERALLSRALRRLLGDR